MVQKKISSKGWLCFSIFLILMAFLGFFAVYNIFYPIVVEEIAQRSYIGLCIVAFLYCFFGFVLYSGFLTLNRWACIVWINKKTNQIGRKGLLGGFKFSISIDNIEDVFIISIPKQGDYIIIIDNFNKSVEGLSKKSYIRLKDTETNIKFIRQIWGKPIVKNEKTLLDFLQKNR